MSEVGTGTVSDGGLDFGTGTVSDGGLDFGTGTVSDGGLDFGTGTVSDGGLDFGTGTDLGGEWQVLATGETLRKQLFSWEQIPSPVVVQEGVLS